VSVVAALIAVPALLVVALVIFMVSRIRTPRAGEILVVTGGKLGPEAHFKKVYVLPFVRRVMSMSTGVQKTEIQLPDAMTSQGVPLTIRAVVAFKIDTDQAVVGNAIERFAEHPESMTDFVHTVFAGHLRAIIGQMTAEAVTTGRDELAKTVRESSTREMTNLGLLIDSVQISDVEDASGGTFLRNWRLKESARMDSEARIAKAAADSAATLREQEAAAANAESVSHSEMKQARARAESERVRAESEQAGPLAAAIARQQVIEADTRATELEAALKERKLQVEVIKPAEAERDAAVARADGEAQTMVLRAKGQRETTQLTAEAEKVKVTLAAEADASRVTLGAKADAARVELAGQAEATRLAKVGDATAGATRANGLAEAEAIAARADALERNSEAVLGQLMLEKLPEIVAAASDPISRVQNLQLLDVKTLQGIPGGNIAAAMGMLPQLVEMMRSFAEQRPTPDGAAPRAAAATIVRDADGTVR